MPTGKGLFVSMVLLITAICFALQYVWNVSAPAPLHLYHGWAVLLPFAVTVTALHFYLTMPGTTAQSFTRTFMATTMLKFIIYAGVLVVFLMFSKQDRRVIAVHFLAYYVIFSIFEVLMLQSAVKKK